MLNKETTWYFCSGNLNLTLCVSLLSSFSLPTLLPASVLFMATISSLFIQTIFCLQHVHAKHFISPSLTALGTRLFKGLDILPSVDTSPWSSLLSPYIRPNLLYSAYSFLWIWRPKIPTDHWSVICHITEDSDHQVGYMCTYPISSPRVYYRFPDRIENKKFMGTQRHTDSHIHSAGYIENKMVS
jgi:hypothetical protein